MEFFSIGKLLGTGGFRDVYKGNLDSIKQVCERKKLYIEIELTLAMFNF
jgi:hypothetical protein